MILVQKWPFFQIFFSGSIHQEHFFYNIVELKTPFQAIKTRSSKNRKIEIFSKGLTLGFGLKMAIFPTFFFQAVQVRKMSFTIFQNKKTPLQAIKTRSSKSRKIEIFFKGVKPWFWSKNGHFSNFFFLGSIPQEHVFYDILEGENAFLGYKNRKFKKPKNDIFRNGLNHGFGPKMAIFPISFFLGNISRENVFYDILERKNAFLSYKNQKFRKSKN